MTTLYKKVGRRYKPVAEHEHTRPHRADQAAARPLHPPTEGVLKMTIDINKLRKLAQTATPGPWLLRTVPTSAGLCHIISAADWRGAFIYGDGLRIGVDDSLPKAQELAANAHLIAAANPAAITELLDRLEAAEKDVALKERIIDSLGSTLNAMTNERDALRTENAALVEDMNLLRNNNTALRAKIEAMERQEPAGWQRLYKDGSSTEDIVDSPNVFIYQRPLYALPGAKGEEK